MKFNVLFFLVIISFQFSFSQTKDSRAYAYRGMHLDVSRHFFSKEIVIKYIDTLAKYHFNYFHWHLTDDQGWRIEIKKYPKLTEVGAWRREKDGTQTGGFYTQEEIKEIVKYAASKSITVIPEIDLPGHSTAAIASYPFLSCGNTPVQVSNHWGIHKDILCPTDSTFQFLFDVLDEICLLFPSPFIHIGGDEVPKQQWMKSEFCNRLMKEKGLKNGEQLQHYFMKRLEDYLLTKGRRSIMWGEAIRGGINDSTIVMSWRGKGAGIKAAKHGNSVIMAPRFSCYFDYPQSRREKKSAWWMTYLTPQKVERFSPRVKSLSLSKNEKILGGEGTLWTEFVTNEKELWHQLTPRIAALGNALSNKK